MNNVINYKSVQAVNKILSFAQLVLMDTTLPIVEFAIAAQPLIIVPYV